MFNITISVQEQDMNYVKKKGISPSLLFRRAIYLVKSGQIRLEETVDVEPLVEEIRRLRKELEQKNGTV